MAEDTLTLAPDTSGEAVEDQVQTLDPETETLSETEDTGADEQDTEDFEAKLEAARTEAKEEAKRELERDTLIQSHKQRTVAANQWLSQNATNEIRKMVTFFAKEAESKGAAEALLQLDPDNLMRGLAGQLAGHVQTREVTGTDQLEDQILADTYKDWRTPTDLIRRKEAALASGDSIEFRKVRFEILRRAVLENDVPNEAKKLTAAEQSKKQKASEVTNLQKVSTSGPTKVGGTAVKPSIGSMNQADAAFNKGEISSKEYGELAKRFGVSLG